ncbi:MAG: biopolymer transporter ExbD [Phycisphaeraceae bacterium]|nr:biopolymer transporter ExbD [Phycisphaeraceae bacterium]
MPSKTIQRGSTAPQMNMTPLIDVTFQLIIFFMLVNNIIAEENVSMIVPSLENPRTRELGEVERVTINMSPQEFNNRERTSRDPLSFPGEVVFVKIGMTQFQTNDLEAITAALKDAKAHNPNVEVLLRGDAALYYKSVEPIMAAVNAAGISTVNLVAAMPGQETAPSGAAPTASPEGGNTP